MDDDIRMGRIVLIKKLQRSINNDFAIKTENFKSGKTTLGYFFIRTPCTTMLTTHVVVLGVRIVS
jgi:hypothetical protein